MLIPCHKDLGDAIMRWMDLITLTKTFILAPLADAISTLVLFSGLGFGGGIS